MWSKGNKNFCKTIIENIVFARWQTPHLITTSLSCVFVERSQEMEKKLTRRQRINKIVVGGLRETIRTHGPITKLFIGSAAKRIVSKLLAKEKRNDSFSSDAK